MRKSDRSPTVVRRKTSRVASKRRAVSSAARERLRQRFRPKRVRVLFVGEAPPASGRFFCHADSGLYRAIRDTFVAAFPDLRKSDFLDSFQSLGCCLIDLCETPVDRMTANSRRRICQAGEARLARRILQLHPYTIVTVVRSIGRIVRQAEQHAGWSGRHIELPYPGRWHHYREQFRRELTPILRATLAAAQT